MIGGSGRFGSKLVPKPCSTATRLWRHRQIPASNTLTGEGFAEVLQGASVVVDVSNTPSFEDAAVMKCFTTSTRNLHKYAAAAGVRHYVALSVVGTERIPDSPYLRAKDAWKTLAKGAGIRYSIVHATQFFAFIKHIADEATDGTTVRLPPVLIQPMAADDVAEAIGRIAVGAPLNGTVEVAGPQQLRFDELIRQDLAARNDAREVVVDPHARYFGAELGERWLIPADDVRLGEIRVQEWLNQPVVQRYGSSRTVITPIAYRALFAFNDDWKAVALAQMRGLWQEFGWKKPEEPRPQSESSIEREFRHRGPVGEEWGRSESLDPDNVGDIADEGAGHRG